MSSKPDTNSKPQHQELASNSADTSRNDCPAVAGKGGVHIRPFRWPDAPISLLSAKTYAQATP